MLHRVKLFALAKPDSTIRADLESDSDDDGAGTGEGNACRMELG